MDKKDWTNAPGMVKGPATTGTVEQQKKLNAKLAAAKKMAAKKMGKPAAKVYKPSMKNGKFEIPASPTK